MPSFQQLVHERTNTDPRHFFANGSKPGQQNPFNGNVAKQVLTTPVSTPPAEAPISEKTSGLPVQPAKQAKGAGRYGDKPLPQRFVEERAATKALFEKVDIIQLTLVMQILGAQGNQDNDKSKWKIPGIGNITVSGQKFWNLETEEGGYGAVNLVKHALNINYPQAVKWLGQAFGEAVDSDEIKASINASTTTPKRTFTPPAKSDKNIAFVKHYLKFTRRIPEELINTLVSQGRIYADDERNCVFASDGIAELRSSFDGAGSVKKLVPGSKRDHGFLVLPDKEKNELTLAICESSIDAMSYHALNPGCAAISAAGVNRIFPRAMAEKASANGFKIIAAFDADKAGDKASQAIFNYFYLKLWLKHKAQVELGKEFDDEQLFELLNTNIVTFQLATRPGEIEDDDDFEPGSTESSEHDEAVASEKRNILFFNKLNPFQDPADPPIILVTIKRNQHGLPQCSLFPVEVSVNGYEFVTKKLGVTRDRPRGEKDWNEVLKNSTVSQPSKAIQISIPSNSM